MERYLLKPPVPLRAVLIGAVVAIVGAGLAVAANSWGWPAFVLWLGVLLVVLGIAIEIAALVTPNRLTVRVTTNADGYHITAGPQVAEGTWDEVVRALQSDTGARITLERRDGSEHHILAPGLTSRATTDALAKDIQGRLAGR